MISQCHSSTESGDSVNFKMVTFPWLPLTMTDRHVIMSTNRYAVLYFLVEKSGEKLFYQKLVLVHAIF